MSLMHLVLIVAIDLAGVVCNIRLLWRCFKEKTQNSFLQNCRSLTIWQSAFQVMIVVADAVELWKGFDIQHRENCNVLRTLSMSTKIFQASNITVIMILLYDHRATNGHGQEVSSKLKISAALSLGFIVSAMIWWYCFSKEFVVHVSAFVACSAYIMFVVYLFVAAFKNNIPEQPKNTSKEASKDTFQLLWEVCKEDKKQLSFIAFLVTCLLVILFDARLSYLFKEFLYLLMARFTVGIVLPLTVIDLINSSYEEENEKKLVLI